MRSPAPSPAPRFGSILPGEVLPVEEAARRLGWRKRLTIDAQRMGLRSVRIGTRKYTTGDWVRQFIEAQAAAEGNGKEAGEQWLRATVTLLDYLAALYPPGTPGELLAYVKKPFARRFGVAANLDAYARQIMALDATQDVYGTINSLDGRSIRQRGPYTRGEESEVVAVVALVADVDAAGKEGHDYPPQPRILQALQDMPLRTSIIVVSGRADGGLHVYWLLLTPFLIQTDEDRDRIKRISREWQRLLKAKLAPYELDSTFDLVRVLRPIGTTNKKYGNTVSALLFQPDRRYRIEDFEWCLPAPPTPRPMSQSSSTMNPGDVPAKARARIARIPGAVSGQGGHDATYRVACLLVEGFALSVADAMPIMQDWNQTCDPPWSEAELLHKLESADANAENRGYMLTNSVVAPANGTKITRLVLAGTAR